MSFYFRYVLGQKDLSNFAASKGSVTHKALELLARKKMALQDGSPTFADPQLSDEPFDTRSFTIEDANRLAFDHYRRLDTHHPWDEEDFRECSRWTKKALEYQGGMLSPLRRHVLAPELFFDFEVEEPWGEYRYLLPDGQVIEGRLRLHGTLDVVYAVDGSPGMVEYCDWKTGKRMDWGKMQEKDESNLRDDFQLRLYHWALTRAYPDARGFLITEYFINHGGAFTFNLDAEDVPRTQELVRRKFEEIRDCEVPRRVKDGYRGRPHWKCNLCRHFTEPLPGQAEPACDQVHREILQLGLDKVTAKYADFSKLGRYGDGGGRRAP